MSASNTASMPNHSQQQQSAHAQSNMEAMRHAVNGVNNQFQTPTFDEFVASPPEGGLDPGGLSFGSILMTDAEMRKLESAGTSFGSVMSYRPTQQNVPWGNNNNRAQPKSARDGDDHVPEAMDSLEPTGVSFGDVSMMSVGTRKLEEVGCSFGTMMSYNTIRGPDAPEGGLEAIGTSFGSLSLDTTNRDTLFHSLELAAAGPEIPPMFSTEERAKGNLLDCSDTDSEDSQSQQQLVAQKSAAWDKMQLSLAAHTDLHAQKSKGTVGSNELMPPPVGRVGSNIASEIKGTVLSVPATNFERDFSQLSAWGEGDDYPNERHGDDDEDDAPPPPPQELMKQTSEGEELNMYYMQQYQQQQR
jgi:hypothetical protein